MMILYNRYMMSVAILILSLFAGCCFRTDRGVITDIRGITGQDGRHVIAEGRVAKEISQHLVSPHATHRYQIYFDISGGQTVVYSKEEINCSSIVRVKGVIVKIEDSSKNPLRKGSVTEYHIIADKWECLK